MVGFHFAREGVGSRVPLQGPSSPTVHLQSEDCVLKINSGTTGCTKTMDTCELLDPEKEQDCKESALRPQCEEKLKKGDFTRDACVVNAGLAECWQVCSPTLKGMSGTQIHCTNWSIPDDAQNKYVKDRLVSDNDLIDNCIAILARWCDAWNEDYIIQDCEAVAKKWRVDQIAYIAELRKGNEIQIRGAENLEKNLEAGTVDKQKYCEIDNKEKREGEIDPIKHCLEGPAKWKNDVHVYQCKGNFSASSYAFSKINFF